MLKKQTVWLLTMLSLMIVLSVYYMTSPGNSGDLAYVDQGEEASEETASSENAEGDASEDDANAEVTDISNVSEDELFTTIRMEIQSERSEEKDRLNDVVASSTASTEEKNQARDEMNQLDDISSKESILEESILAAADYNDVLVRHEDGKVLVHVKETEKLSNSEVVNIMQMVRDEFGDITVDVDYQAVES
ncbi:SpoIIIAH-like family protein [Lentibacillus amyloliquefaciens]|uniref:Stage III sporulation protein AH n=1 Tax=Lentibacillus amyloliquefaciens TaxID=1472767 RepID=A0A0U3WE29_9BACI|nr:SpoIIIAH-like family protein [Lentibacillus amyloliquefaciens]ALX48047.1 stage III sporulation protein AH [Lentibacillus amyloliquefaciens]